MQAPKLDQQEFVCLSRYAELKKCEPDGSVSGSADLDFAYALAIDAQARAGRAAYESADPLAPAVLEPRISSSTSRSTGQQTLPEEPTSIAVSIGPDYAENQLSSESKADSAGLGNGHSGAIPLQQDVGEPESPDGDEAWVDAGEAWASDDDDWNEAQDPDSAVAEALSLEEFDIFDFTPDTEDTDEPDYPDVFTRVDTGEVRVSDDEKAGQLGLEICENLGDFSDELFEVVRDILSQSPRKQTARALERLVKAGARPEDLQLCGYLRSRWRQQDLYHLGLRRWLPDAPWYRSQMARSELGWSNALEIVQAFPSTPSEAELDCYLEDAYERWRSHSRCMACYPEFMNYLLDISRCSQARDFGWPMAGWQSYTPDEDDALHDSGAMARLRNELAGFGIVTMS